MLRLSRWNVFHSFSLFLPSLFLSLFTSEREDVRRALALLFLFVDLIRLIFFFFLLIDWLAHAYQRLTLIKCASQIRWEISMCVYVCVMLNMMKKISWNQMKEFHGYLPSNEFNWGEREREKKRRRRMTFAITDRFIIWAWPTLDIFFPITFQWRRIVSLPALSHEKIWLIRLI